MTRFKLMELMDEFEWLAFFLGCYIGGFDNKGVLQKLQVVENFLRWEGEVHVQRFTEWIAEFPCHFHGRERKVNFYLIIHSGYDAVMLGGKKVKEGLTLFDPTLHRYVLVQHERCGTQHFLTVYTHLEEYLLREIQEKVDQETGDRVHRS